MVRPPLQRTALMWLCDLKERAKLEERSYDFSSCPRCSDTRRLGALFYFILAVMSQSAPVQVYNTAVTAAV